MTNAADLAINIIENTAEVTNIESFFGLIENYIMLIFAQLDLLLGIENSSLSSLIILSESLEYCDSIAKSFYRRYQCHKHNLNQFHTKWENFFLDWVAEILSHWTSEDSQCFVENERLQWADSGWSNKQVQRKEIFFRMSLIWGDLTYYIRMPPKISIILAELTKHFKLVSNKRFLNVHLGKRIK
jgi:hypothetical protein